MAKEVMRRHASDNTYLHKDFHGTLSLGIEYLDKNYGPDAVREYLKKFARSYYAPLSEDIRKRGLIALKERIERVYAEEGGEIEISFSEDEMTVRVKKCPAVIHMKTHNYPVARLFFETERIVNETICENTPFSATLLSYDPETGASTTRYARRQP